jgi:hypothetical protein
MKIYLFLVLACLTAFVIAGMIYLEMTQQIFPD